MQCRQGQNEVELYCSWYFIKGRRNGASEGIYELMSWTAPIFMAYKHRSIGNEFNFTLGLHCYENFVAKFKLEPGQVSTVTSSLARSWVLSVIYQKPTNELPVSGITIHRYMSWPVLHFVLTVHNDRETMSASTIIATVVRKINKTVSSWKRWPNWKSAVYFTVHSIRDIQ